MTSAVTDTGYWLADTTGDRAPDVFNAGGETTEHQYPPGTDNHSHNVTDLDHIQDVLTRQIPDQHPTIEEAVGEETTTDEITEDPVDEVPEDGLEDHPDPSTDAAYTSRPKRTIIPSQKSVLNNK